MIGTVSLLTITAKGKAIAAAILECQVAHEDATSRLIASREKEIHKAHTDATWEAEKALRVEENECARLAQEAEVRVRKANEMYRASIALPNLARDNALAETHKNRRDIINADPAYAAALAALKALLGEDTNGSH